MIRVTKVTRTCHACPSQWEGETDDGRFVYARYRWGALTVGIGVTLAEAIKARRRFYWEGGSELDGCMDYGELRDATFGHFTWPDTEGQEDG